MRSARQTAGTCGFALAIVLALGVGEPAQAACYTAGEQLPAQVVSQFINDPGRLLAQFPAGGPQMISLIRDLAASDPGTLSLIINLDTKANPEEVQAIGTGLGQAALVCGRTAQAFSNEIQQMTVNADNRFLTQAFSAVMGDLFLSAAGPAGGGGGGGSTAPSAAIGGVAASNNPLSLTTSVLSAASSTFGNSGGSGGRPGGQSSSVSPNSIVTPSTIAKSVSSSIP
jgi:hypothetical protein